jgi:hypothetical protein
MPPYLNFVFRDHSHPGDHMVMGSGCAMMLIDGAKSQLGRSVRDEARRYGS